MQLSDYRFCEAMEVWLLAIDAIAVLSRASWAPSSDFHCPLACVSQRLRLLSYAIIVRISGPL